MERAREHVYFMFDISFATSIPCCYKVSMREVIVLLVALFGSKMFSDSIKSKLCLLIE